MPREPLTPEREALVRAEIENLEPTEDSHWTTTGKPAVANLTQRLGFVVSAPDVERLAPGVTRDHAYALAERQMDEFLGVQGQLPNPSPEKAASPDMVDPAPAPAPLVVPDKPYPLRGEGKGDGFDPESPLDAPFDAMIRTPERITLVQQAIAERTAALVRERMAIDAEMTRIGRIGGLLDRAAQIRRPPEDERREQVQAIQKRAVDARQDAANTAAKLRATGLTKDSLRKALDPRSPLDRALNATGRGRGTKRPAPLAVARG